MDNNVPLAPVNFFQLSVDCHKLPSAGQAPFTLSLKNYSKYLLPDLSGLTGEESFAKVSLGWSSEGIELFAYIEQPYFRTVYPNYDKGDSLELCIDTRDVKTSGYNTRFCHHFYFLPETVEGFHGGELTKFRTEDAHEPCNPLDLQVQSQFKKDYYTMQCLIPAHCLHGYDPEQFDRMGMTYRITRVGGPSQQFSVLAEEYKFQEQPSLWCSMRLVP